MSDAAPKSSALHAEHHEADLVETIQSLIVAFVLAMTFRGFVVEGFVIPTGSMAPTLMGAHAQIHSRQTGYVFPVGMDQPVRGVAEVVADPMLGPDFPGSAQALGTPPRRMGDRILVLKCLYPFFQPQRYDVVVFKNPTRSQGDEANYIKRLIGLPEEELWLCDGDVFARPADDGRFTVQPKPDHVQRAVWQPVHHSDFVPVNIERVNEGARRRWSGPPWVAGEGAWSLDDRAYRSESNTRAQLHWDEQRRTISDWTPYNMLLAPRPMNTPVAVSDVRVAATIVPDSDGLTAQLELLARSHVFQFIIEPDRAAIIMRPAEEAPGSPREIVHEAAINPRAAGRPFTVECWHVDQQVRLFIDGEEAVEAIRYDWTPIERLQNATGIFSTDDADALLRRPVMSATMRWMFEGSALTMYNVQVDRDLFYRRAWINDDPSRPGFGTHPDNAAVLDADQFMMAGDNSQASLDSRLWGYPDGLVASQIDPSPFVVNRRLLLGKAWVVYFPAPYPIKQGGPSVIPDFGRLRFIR